jgi:hypothetical protein
MSAIVLVALLECRKYFIACFMNELIQVANCIVECYLVHLSIYTDITTIDWFGSRDPAAVRLGIKLILVLLRYPCGSRACSGKPSVLSVDCRRYLRPVRMSYRGIN